MNLRNIEKYLKHYAEREADIAAELAASRIDRGPWDCVVAIPACGEQGSLPALCTSLAAAANKQGCYPLVIILINHRSTAPSQTKEDNAATWQNFVDALDNVLSSTGKMPWILGSKDAVSYLVIDRFSIGHEFPEKQGVGLARKIGSDIATALIYSRDVISPIIFNTDADAIVGTDYFDCSQLNVLSQSMDTFLTPFIHTIPATATAAEAEAISLYDRYLRTYVDGLQRANSPYGFHTVGSTISYHVNAYAAVRGFPRREAGEDFYLLNKLAKVGKIRERKVQPVILQGRISYRVPFGTGASVGRISQMLERGEEYTIYDDRSFDLLKIWLEAAQLYLAGGSEEELFERLQNKISALGISGAPEAVLAHLNESQAIEFLRNSRNRAKKSEQVFRAFADWFDAFRTLKFVHAIRDNLLAAKPLKR